jgi:2,4-diaminopentanoate dehydrogenase
MPYRVVQWSTGNVGRHALAGIEAHPDLQLVGVFVSTPSKVGHDAGDLAGLPRILGVAGTNDADALLALKPDCIVHTAMADDRIFEALGDLERFLAAGCNVVSSSPVMLQYPAPGDALAAPVIAAAEKAGVSIFVNGVDPGFANDALPLVLTGICERIEEVRCSEVLNYNTYNQPMVLFDIMGFGRDLRDVPLLLSPGVLISAWGSVVRQIADGLGVTLTDVTEWYEREAAPEDFEVDAGTIKAGTAAALHFEVRGMVGDRPVIVLEHVTRLRDDLGAAWPQPAGQGCYRVQITGEPNYTLDLQLMGTDGDHNTAGLKATAMRLVNAVPAVVQAAPGLVTALDLPLVTGRGLVVTWTAKNRRRSGRVDPVPEVRRRRSHRGPPASRRWS